MLTYLCSFFLFVKFLFMKYIYIYKTINFISEDGSSFRGFYSIILVQYSLYLKIQRSWPRNITNEV